MSGAKAGAGPSDAWAGADLCRRTLRPPRDTATPVVQSVDDLRIAAEALRAAKSRLDAALVQKGVRRFIRIRSAATAIDILDAVVLLTEAHTAAESAQDEETRRMFEAMPVRIPPPDSQTWTLEELSGWQATQPQPTTAQWEEVMRLMQGEVTSEPYAKVKVAYKAMLFFTRAHQDALYRAFLEARGEQAGVSSSMASALMTGKPLGQVLAEDVPGYAEWFFRWRDRRNRVKDGVSFAFTGLGGLGLLFQSVTDEGGVTNDLAQTPLSLPDIVEAVAMSAAATDSIAGHVESLTRSSTSSTPRR
jgi:hypothetical protein